MLDRVTKEPLLQRQRFYFQISTVTHIKNTIAFTFNTEGAICVCSLERSSQNCQKVFVLHLFINYS